MVQTLRKTRQSNFELLRIICMLMVVAHHSVLYSGVQDAYDLAHPTLNLFFCQIWGMWGKTAINVFVLISGYFMCKQELRMGRFLKLLCQVKLYDISIFIVCVLIGYDVLSVSRVLYILFQNVRQINHAFTGSFLVIYLLIPFNNILIANMNRLQHTALVALGLGVFMVGGTFMGNPGVFNHVSWYVVLYYVGAYIRLYPYRWMSRLNIISIALAGAISLYRLSVRIACSFSL